MTSPPEGQLGYAIQQAMAEAAGYLALVTRVNPLGSADAMLARPDIDAMLSGALEEAQALAEDLVRQQWYAAGAPVSADETLGHLLADVARIFDALAHLRGLIRHAHASVPPRGFISGVTQPGDHPSARAAEERGTAVRDAILAWARKAALRARMSSSVADGLGGTAATLEDAFAREAAGERLAKRWRAHVESPTCCLWCRRLNGVTIGLRDSFVPYLGDPVAMPQTAPRRVATPAGTRRYGLPAGSPIVWTHPPRPYHGRLQGPVLHPFCVLPGTRVMPGDEGHGISFPVPAPGLSADGGPLAAAAVTEPVGDGGWADVRAVTERDYVGEIVVVKTALGHELSVTPNHPVATRGGWVAAAQLQAGDHVLSSTKVEWHPPGDRPDVEHVPPAIEEVAEAFPVVLGTVPGSAEDFHGDGTKGEVCVVRADRRLVADLEAQFANHGSEVKLCLRDVPGIGTAVFVCGGLAEEDAVVLARAAHSLMGSSGIPLAFFRGQLAVPQTQSLALPADGGSGAEEPVADDSPADSEGFCERLLALSPGIALDEIIEVQRYSGHTKVYNLSTGTGWYLAEGIVTHNCRCRLEIVRVGAAAPGSAPESVPTPVRFLTAAGIRDMSEDDYQADRAFLQAAVHELDQVLKRLAGGRG